MVEEKRLILYVLEPRMAMTIEDIKKIIATDETGTLELKKSTHTSRTLSILLDISQRTVEREISFLRNNGFIDKEGSTKNGTWRVLI